MMSFLLVIERLLLTVISAVISSMYIYYSLQALVADDQPLRYSIYALVSLGYGVAMLVCLWRAWLFGGQAVVRLVRFSTVAYVMIFLVAVLDLAMNTMVEETLLVFLGVCLAANWHSVRLIARRVRKPE